MGHRHVCCCAASDPPLARPSSWCTDDDRLPSKSSLGGHRSHHDACQGKIHQDGHRITSTMCHASTPHLKTHGTTVSRLPLVYKKRRRPPSHGGRRIAHSRYWHLPQSDRRDLEASPPLPPSLYPPLRAPRCPAIQCPERTPAGHTAHGRNQDKPCVPVLLSTGHQETDLSASAS
jgi:hypothetical protein